MATVEKISDALAERGIQVGQTRVVAVRARLDRDPSGEEPIIIIKLVLAAPPAGLDTWPNDDLWTIRAITNEHIRNSEPEPEIPWLVTFVSEDQGDLDPDDTADEVEIDL